VSQVSTTAELDTIVQALSPLLDAHGLDLYDVELTGSGRARTLRVLVDRPAGAPVDLDAIAAATEAISPVLDRAPLDAVLRGPYALEVSSPGLERPLRTRAHFARAVGETISVKTSAEGAPTRRVRGVIHETTDESFTLRYDDGTTEQFDYTDVRQARTVFEWGAPPRRGRRGHQRSREEVVRP
jgi:ribosome maturation factor RimP